MFPKVSICIPVYNGQSTIRRAVNSSLSQNYDNIEVIISDNCSKDRTVQIIKNEYNGIVKLLERDKNYGELNNFEFLVEHATGDYIILLGADDKLEQDCLHTLANLLNNRSSNVAFGKSLRIWSDEKEDIVTIPKCNSLRLLEKSICSKSKMNFLIMGLWKKEVFLNTLKLSCSILDKLNLRYSSNGTLSDRLFVYFALQQYGVDYQLTDKIVYLKYYDSDNDNRSRRKSFIEVRIYSVLICLGFIAKQRKKVRTLSLFLPRWVFYQIEICRRLWTKSIVELYRMIILP